MATNSTEMMVAKAKRLELGSAAANFIPPLNWFVHGRRNAIPHLEYRRWLYVPGLLASSVDWIEFGGDDGQKSGLPKNWYDAAILGVDRLELARLAANNRMGGVPTYFYRLDPEAEVVMAAPFPYGKDSRFNGSFIGERSENLLAIATRIGAGALMASAGLMDLSTRQAAAFKSDQIYSQRASLYAVNHGSNYASVAII